MTTVTCICSRLQPLEIPGALLRVPSLGRIRPASGLVSHSVYLISLTRNSDVSENTEGSSLLHSVSLTFHNHPSPHPKVTTRAKPLSGEPGMYARQLCSPPAPASSREPHSSKLNRSGKQSFLQAASSLTASADAGWAGRGVWEDQTAAGDGTWQLLVNSEEQEPGIRDLGEGQLLPLSQFLTKMLESTFSSAHGQPVLTEVCPLKLASSQEKLLILFFSSLLIAWKRGTQAEF